MRKRNPCLQNDSGFTLVETAIVVVLVAILSAIAIPSFSTILNATRTRTTNNRLAEIKKAIVGDAATGSVGFVEMTGYYPGEDFPALTTSLATLWQGIETAATANFIPRVDTGMGSVQLEEGTIWIGQDGGFDAWNNDFIVDRAAGAQYIVYSMGPNETDDSGVGDDIALAMR